VQSFTCNKVNLSSAKSSGSNPDLPAEKAIKAFSKYGEVAQGALNVESAEAS